jgi:hypothetical protein
VRQRANHANHRAKVLFKPAQVGTWRQINLAILLFHPFLGATMGVVSLATDLRRFGLTSAPCPSCPHEGTVYSKDAFTEHITMDHREELKTWISLDKRIAQLWDDATTPRARNAQPLPQDPALSARVALPHQQGEPAILPPADTTLPMAPGLSVQIKENASDGSRDHLAPADFENGSDSGAKLRAEAPDDRRSGCVTQPSAIAAIHGLEGDSTDCREDCRISISIINQPKGNPPGDTAPTLLKTTLKSQDQLIELAKGRTSNIPICSLHTCGSAVWRSIADDKPK